MVESHHLQLEINQTLMQMISLSDRHISVEVMTRINSAATFRYVQFECMRSRMKISTVRKWLTLFFLKHIF